jgi:ABC-2 type transport system ATP-binding protein
MIQIQNLSYKYSGATENVFDGLTLSFDEGKIFGLLGKNGVGKSTLLHLLSGLLMPREGRILIDGQEPRLRQPSLQEEVFFVPDEFSLPAMPLTRYVKYREPFYPRFSQEILRQCLQDFEIDMHSHLDKLSLGEKKRVLVSFALATQCRVLLMDEPTNGLDIPAKTLFRKLVARHMSDNQTIIVSTHQVHDVDALLDHIVIMDAPAKKDSILLDASIAELQERFAFQYRSMNEPCDDALYFEPTPQGRAVIVTNRAGEETTVNLELLFNAVVKGKVTK